MDDDPFILAGGVVELDAVRISYEQLGPLHVRNRHVVCGENGAGKSTLVRCISGVIPEVQHGDVRLSARIGEREVVQSTRYLAGGSVGVLPQDVREYLLGLPVSEEWRAALAVMRSERHAAAGMIYSSCRIQEFGDRSSLELSDGEKQRVAVACALAASPAWLMLDEWRSHLDDHWLYVIDTLLNTIVEDYSLGTVELAAAVGELDASNETLRTHVERLGVAGKRLELPNRTRALDEVLERSQEQPSDFKPPIVAFPPTLRLPCETIHLPSVSVPGGQLGVISGPNGSGKTTLLKTIARRLSRRGRMRSVLVLADPSLQLLGKDLETVLHSYATVSEGETGQCAQQIANVLDIPVDVDLLDLSFGSRKLLALLIAAVSASAVLLVDEPFDGLDNASRTLALHILRHAAIRRRMTVIVSSARGRAAEEFDEIPIVPLALAGTRA